MSDVEEDHLYISDSGEESWSGEALVRQTLASPIKPWKRRSAGTPFCRGGLIAEVYAPSKSTTRKTMRALPCCQKDVLGRCFPAALCAATSSLGRHPPLTPPSPPSAPISLIS